MQLRQYQSDLKRDVYDQWASGHENVLAVLPTGGGKTVIFSDVIREHEGGACVIAHRQELVMQISLSLSNARVRHRIIAPNNVVKLIVRQQMLKFGKVYYDPTATVAVAGVDTLVRLNDRHKKWCDSVSLWVQDEAHHVVKDNKWGTAIKMFPNARGLGVTATPLRADGKGLGRHSHGLFNTMVCGPTMRDLIRLGYLTDYRIISPPNNLNISNVPLSASGEFSPKPLDEAVKTSCIIGDIASHYKRFANGKLGITFTTTVEAAELVAAQYNNHGIPAAVVSAKTTNEERVRILRDFESRKLLQLVNCDLFGEGFDLPAIEVVTMVRPTKSFGLYCQQFGRALRILSGKLRAIIIDHVRNVDCHGLPDARQAWTLDARDTRGKQGPSDAIPVRTCPNPICVSTYERTHSECPYCGFRPTPVERSGPEYVDGDLTELDPAILAEMRGDIDRVDGPFYAREDMSRPARLHAAKHHALRQETQSALRASMAWWAGWQRSIGRSDAESYKLFYFTFGTDVVTAQSLNAKDATKLANNINIHIGRADKW